MAHASRGSDHQPVDVRPRRRIRQPAWMSQYEVELPSAVNRQFVPDERIADKSMQRAKEKGSFSPYSKLTNCSIVDEDSPSEHKP